MKKQQSKFKGELRVRSNTWEKVNPDSNLTKILSAPNSALYEIEFIDRIIGNRAAIIHSYETSKSKPYFVEGIKLEVMLKEQINLGDGDKLSVYGITKIIKREKRKYIKDRDGLRLAINEIQNNLWNFLNSDQPNYRK